MNNKNNIREFLMSRRARLSPEQARLPVYDGNRRVKGLRREEVAMLADISVDYYIKLERGSIGSVSGSVLSAVSRALQLTTAERDHLFHLAGITEEIKKGRSQPTSRTVRSTVKQIIESMTDAPAFVTSATGDILAANSLGRAVYSPLFTGEEAVPNTARFMFLDPAARAFFPEWDANAADTVANLRAYHGANPYDEQNNNLIDELNRESTEFQVLWRAHDVRYHDTGHKRIHHPVVGLLILTYEMLELSADPGQSLTVYGAQPGSATDDALKLLSSWATEDYAPSRNN